MKACYLKCQPRVNSQLMRIIHSSSTLTWFTRHTKGGTATVPWSFSLSWLLWASHWGRRVRAAVVVRAAESVLLRAEFGEVMRERVHRVIGAQRLRAGQMMKRRRSRRCSDCDGTVASLQACMHFLKTSKDLNGDILDVKHVLKDF